MIASDSIIRLIKDILKIITTKQLSLSELKNALFVIKPILVGPEAISDGSNTETAECTKNLKRKTKMIRIG